MPGIGREALFLLGEGVLEIENYYGRIIFIKFYSRQHPTKGYGPPDLSSSRKKILILRIHGYKWHRTKGLRTDHKYLIH